MKNLLFILLLIPIISNSQNQIQLQSSIDSLLKCNSILNSEISKNNKKIADLKEKSALLILNKSQLSSISVIVKSPTRILNEEYVFADTMAVAKTGDTILIVGYSTDYFITKYKRKTGFIRYTTIAMSDDLINFKELSLRNMLNNEKDENKKDIIQHEINVFNKQKIEYASQNFEAAKALERQRRIDETNKRQNILNAEKEKQRKIELYKKYGQTIGQKILDGKIWLGMTSDMAKASWGLPEKNNRTVGSFGVHEQWVYSSSYLYFEDGILTSWQD